MRIRALLLCFLLVLTGCGSAVAPGGSSGGGQSAAPGSGTDKSGQPAIDDREKALVAGAKAEGSLVIWGTIIQPDTHEALAAAFRKRYGLPDNYKVDSGLMGSGDVVSKVTEELKAGRLTADVLSVSALPWLYDLIKQDQLLNYESPAYADYGPARDAGMTEKGYWVADAYTFVPMWNPQFVKKSITSWNDLNDPAFAGKFLVGDAGTSPTYANTYVGVRKVMDKGFFQENAKLKPAFLTRSEQIAQMVASGEYVITASGMPTRAYQLAKQGVQLELSFPKEGVVLLPQPFVIMKAAKHPNAAKLWIDFIFSEEGQNIYQKYEGLMSGRAGFKSPDPKYAPSVSQVKAIPMDWKNLGTPEVNAAQDEWKSMYKAK